MWWVKHLITTPLISIRQAVQKNKSTKLLLGVGKGGSGNPQSLNFPLFFRKTSLSLTFLLKKSLSLKPDFKNLSPIPNFVYNKSSILSFYKLISFSKFWTFSSFFQMQLFFSKMLICYHKLCRITCFLLQIPYFFV